MKRLWYTKPATCWEEILPLGSGALGAMVWGDPLCERIGLNHERLWSGYYADSNPKRAVEFLPEVRELIFSGHYAKAERIMERYFLGAYTQSYMPAGDLWVQREGAAVTEYERELVLDTAVATTRCRVDGVAVEQTCFTSHPAKALVMRWKSEANQRVQLRWESQMRLLAAEKREQGICFHLQCPEHVDPQYLGERENAILWGERGMHFDVCIRVLQGSAQVLDDGLQLEGKDLIWTVQVLDTEPVQGTYAELLAAHKKDFGTLYGRVELEMPGHEDLPTDVRLQDPDPGMYALYYQYARYLLISSSREGGLPPNLQGIWNWQLRAPWSSNWTLNINAEMNMWPALMGNLKECVLPYVGLVEQLCREGQKTAAAFGCRGSATGHNTDGWFTTQPVGVARGEEGGEEGCLMWAGWLMGQVWMNQEVWRTYWYHPDLHYLHTTVYPLLKESVLFCLDWLVEYEDKLVTCPATTPENVFVEEGERVSVSWATRLDIELIRELFMNFSALIREMQSSEMETQEMQELGDRVAKALAKLPNPVLDENERTVCEWFEPKEEAEPGHRHVSHLYAMFPGNLWRANPELQGACERTLEKRMAAGGGHTGWSLAWIINLYAILQKPEKVEEYLRQMLVRSSYGNLWSKHPPFQIDGNFGAAAAIGHMLVEESENKEVSLLPCLPPSWTEGCVRGLRLPGGREIAFTWKNGAVTEVEIVEK